MYTHIYTCMHLWVSFLAVGLPGQFGKLSESIVLEKIFCGKTIFILFDPTPIPSTHYCQTRQLKAPSNPSLKLRI